MVTWSTRRRWKAVDIAVETQINVMDRQTDRASYRYSYAAVFMSKNGYLVNQKAMESSRYVQ